MKKSGWKYRVTLRDVPEMGMVSIYIEGLDGPPATGLGSGGSWRDAAEEAVRDYLRTKGSETSVLCASLAVVEALLDAGVWDLGIDR